MPVVVHDAQVMVHPHGTGEGEGKARGNFREPFYESDT